MHGHTNRLFLMGTLCFGLSIVGGCGEENPLDRLCIESKPKTMTWEKCNDAGWIEAKENKFTQARKYFSAALAIAEKINLADSPNLLLTSLANLAGAYQSEGNFAEAEPLLKRALVIHEKSGGPESLGVAEGLNNLAGLYQQQGRLAEAEPLFKRALSIRRANLNEVDFKVIASQHNLALFYLAQKRIPEAEAVFKDAIAVVRKNKDTAPQLILLLEGYIYLLQSLNRNDETLDMVKEVRRLKGWSETPMN